MDKLYYFVQQTDDTLPKYLKIAEDDCVGLLEADRTLESLRTMGMCSDKYDNESNNELSDIDSCDDDDESLGGFPAVDNDDDDVSATDEESEDEIKPDDTPSAYVEGLIGTKGPKDQCGQVHFGFYESVLLYSFATVLRLFYRRTRALLQQYPEDSSITNTVMRIWLRRRSKLVHDCALVGFLLSPNQTIMTRVNECLDETPIFHEAVQRLIYKLLVRSYFVGEDRKNALADLVDKFWDEHISFKNRSGVLGGDVMWMAAKGEQVQAHRWHQKYTRSRTKVLGRLACLVTSKILGIGTAERNWKQYKKIKSGERTNLNPTAAMKITCIYGGHQQTKARKRMNQLSVAGKLWSDDDFHCLKMDQFCGDLASSLDEDVKMRARKPFRNLRERWEMPPKGIPPSGDALLHDKLKNKYVGIMLLYDGMPYLIHDVVFDKKRGDNRYLLLCINSSFK